MATKPLSETAKQQAEEKLLKQPGVTGVDVGYKYVGGERTDDLAIRVMVEQKRASVPAAERVPATIDGVTTDVIQRKFFLHAPRNQKPVEELDLQSDGGTYNPVKGGVSIGPVRPVNGIVWAGTLGAVVRDNKTGSPLILSNFHVLAVDEDARPGDAIAQPSLVDGGRDPTSIVGVLQRTALTEAVDSAVATLQNRAYSGDIVDIGAITGTAAATPGMAVRKRGRTTGLTHGFVDGISLSITLPYPGNIGPKTLINQIDVRPDTAHNAEFADHGDSGSVLVNNEGKIVGLHFAGSDDGHGIANPIAEVLAALDVSIIAGGAKTVLKDDLSDGKAAQVKEIKIEKEAKVELLEKQKAEFLEKQKEKNEKFETKDFKDTETFSPDKSYQPESGGPTMSAQSDDPSLQKSGTKLELTETGSGGGGGGSGGGGGGGKTSDTPPPKNWQKDFKDLKDTLKEVKEKEKEKDKDKDKDKELFKETHPEISDKPPFKEIKDFQDGSDGNLMAAASAKPPIDGKLPDKQPVDKPVKSDKEKVEIKENKPESKELKPEFKEHKPESKELKNESKNESKELKSERKDQIKEKIEIKEKAEFKDHKNENKEFKIELKEHKPEFEKPFRENMKDLVEGGQKFVEGGDPILQGPGGGLQGASAQVGLKPHVDKFKDFKEIEKIRIEKNWHKDLIKDHIADKHFPDKPMPDKQIFEGGGGKQIFEGGGGKQAVEGGDPFQTGMPALQGAGAPAALKHADKLFDKNNNLKPEGKIEFKDHKNENKEFKNEKFEGKDKNEKIEHKDKNEKIENKEKVEIKDHKNEIKELKGEKDFKVENKEHGKFENFENQKQVFEGGPKFAEAGDLFQQQGGGLQAASGAAAALKHVDKPVDKTITKQEGIDKLAIKDHKPEQKIELKDQKSELKDHKNEFKDHKNEWKEHVKEKPEIKEHMKTEFEKVTRENMKDLVENQPKFMEGGDPFQVNPFQVNQGMLGLQAASAPVAAHKVKENIKSEIEKIKREKEFDKVKPEKEHIKEIEKIKPEKEHVKEIEKIKPEKEFAKDFTKEFQIDKHKVEFEKIFPEHPKQLVEGGPKLAEGFDPVRPGTPAPGLQGASEPQDGDKTAGTTQAAGAQAGATAAKIKEQKAELEKHPKLELEKIKFEGEKTIEKIVKDKDFEKPNLDKVKFEKEKDFEKPFLDGPGPKQIVEGGPGFPNFPDPASRIAQLEAAVAQLSTFIPQNLRPDLGGGALTNEPDQKPAPKGEAKAEQKADTKPDKAESKSESKSDPKGKKS